MIKELCAYVVMVMSMVMVMVEVLVMVMVIVVVWIPRGWETMPSSSQTHIDYDRNAWNDGWSLHYPLPINGSRAPFLGSGEIYIFVHFSISREMET